MTTTATSQPEAVPAVERIVAADMIRRGLPVAPIMLLAAGLVWGLAGVASSAYGLGLALGNLALSAVLLAWAARRSPSMLMGAALGGFLLRLGLLTAAVALVRHRTWVEMVPLGVTILVTHLGLLWWETRHLSISLAFPALKPPPPAPSPSSVAGS